MRSPPPPYTPCDHSADAKGCLVRRKEVLGRSSKLLPPPAIVKRDIWWLVCPPTFGYSHKTLANWHIISLFVLGLTFMWLSTAVPNHLEAIKDKDFDRERVGQFFMAIGLVHLPFAFTGYLGMTMKLPNLFVPTAIFYQTSLMFIFMPFLATLIVTLKGIFWANLQMTIWAAQPTIGLFIVLAAFFHGYRIIIRVSNDMRDDWLDANPHLIPGWEPASQISRVSSITSY